jgi:hypothetical protein
MAKKEPVKREYEEGKVYLRDTRNGMIHEYQELLANMSYMERFIYSKGAEQERRLANVPTFKSSAQERAADFDRLAAMKPEEREAELKRRTDYVEEQQRLKEQTDKLVETPTRKMTDKAAGVPYEDFVAQGWSDELLVEQGYMEALTDESEPPKA